MKRLHPGNMVPLLIVSLGLLVGCEDGGGGLGAGHDFGANDPMVVVALGDSITEGHGLASADTYPVQLAPMIGKIVINEGAGGETSDGGASRVGGVLRRHNPGYLLILYGANDVIRDMSLNDAIAHLGHIIDVAKANNTIPVLATLLPAYDGHAYMQGGIAELNPMIRQLAAATGTALVDMEATFGSDETLLQSDGLHPSATGTRLMAQAFAGQF